MGFLLLEDPQIISDKLSHKHLPIIPTHCEFQLSTQAVQKGPFSISELIIGLFLFKTLASFQLTLTGNNKSHYRYDMYR